jgi:hypothetical protein
MKVTWKEIKMFRKKIYSAILTVSVVTVGFAFGFSYSALAQCDKRQPSQTTAQQQHQHGNMHKGHDQQIPRYYKNVNDLKETPKTLSPEQFADLKVKQAYEVAHDNPKLLLQLPCFCNCDQSKGHNSLLDCFVDEHGANCDICIDEAVKAAKLESENWNIEKIREKIIADFSKAH